MPCDYSKYPKDWKAIRARILEREGHRCKFCGVHDRWLRVGESIIRPGGQAAFYAGEDFAAGIGPKPRLIVLTVAHLDHNLANNSDDNLAALCQACHLRYDAKHHAANASATRSRKAGQPPLIKEATT